jgi:hypothetical protein
MALVYFEEDFTFALKKIDTPMMNLVVYFCQNVEELIFGIIFCQ